jgi:hypothetical protein
MVGSGLLILKPFYDLLIAAKAKTNRKENMSADKEPLHRIEFAGLDGSNLLAFMAAVGTLRLLTNIMGRGISIYMSWSDASGVWVPTLHHSILSTPEQVTEQLGRSICSKHPRQINPALEIGPDLTLLPDEFRGHARRALELASPGQREFADFLAAFGCEACVGRDKKGFIEDTDLRTMSGAGHQHFIGFMAELSVITEPEHLHSALFAPWGYDDDRPSMRWDPNDYRPYALRAGNPAKDPIKTVRGANRLAIEALPIFAAAPTSTGLKTTAFSLIAGEVSVTWPIWTTALDYDSLRSLLALADLRSDIPDRLQLSKRGIAQVYRARRFTDGKFRSFSRAREVI